MLSAIKSKKVTFKHVESEKEDKKLQENMTFLCAIAFWVVFC